jgi:hypothetical protein
MGEARRLRDQGIQFKQLQPGQEIQVDLKNATPKICECGSKFFVAAIKVFTVSALLSPIGKEITAQVPVLVCQKCQKVLEIKEVTKPVD